MGIVRGSSPFLFDQSSNNHRESREYDPDSHPLEERDAGVVAGDSAEGGDEEAVIEGEEESDGEEGDDADWAGGDEEGGTQVAVHLEGLRDRERPLLNHGGEAYHATGPDWGDSDQTFHFFDLLNAAESPLVCWSAVWLEIVFRYNRSFVENSMGKKYFDHEQVQYWDFV